MSARYHQMSQMAKFVCIFFYTWHRKVDTLVVVFFFFLSFSSSIGACFPEIFLSSGHCESDSKTNP